MIRLRKRHCFDRRRHGTISMGACGLSSSRADAVRERGMRGIVELLSSETNNSAFHGTRLDVDHRARMNNLDWISGTAFWPESLCHGCTNGVYVA